MKFEYWDGRSHGVQGPVVICNFVVGTGNWELGTGNGKISQQTGPGSYSDIPQLHLVPHTWYHIMCVLETWSLEYFLVGLFIEHFFRSVEVSTWYSVCPLKRGSESWNVESAGQPFL